MAINLSALSKATTAATALSNLILVSPQRTIGYQPQNGISYEKNTAPQPSALLFNYEGEQSATLASDITDHWIEDNTPIQDQVALKPVLISVQGFVGELNDIAPPALQPLKTAAEKLTVLSAYVPSLSATALLAYANAFQLYQVAANAARSAIDAWSTINGAGSGAGGGETVINGTSVIVAENQTQQQIYFQQFYGYWERRTLFTVQTPWAVFQDMVIQNMRAIQNAETRMISDFEIIFKQMRFASTQLITADTLYSDNTNMQGRAATAGAKVEDLGTSTLQTSPTSFSTAFS